MTLCSITILPADMPQLDNLVGHPAAVVPTQHDLILAATKPDHWYEPSTWLNGVSRDNGVLDRTLVSLTATPPAVATIGGKSYLTMGDVSALGAADAGPTIESVAEFTIILIRHPNSSSTNDVIFAKPADETSGASNRLMNLSAFLTSGTESYTLTTEGGGGATIFNTAAFPAQFFSRSLPHMLIISYSVTNGFRFKIDTGSAYNAQVASPTSTQVPTNKRLQLGRLGSSSGASNFDGGAFGTILTYSRDLTKTAYATEFAGLQAQLIADYGIV